MLEHSKPTYQINTLDPSSMNIGKLWSGGDLMSDTFYRDRKTRHFFYQIHETREDLRKENSDDIHV